MTPFVPDEIIDEILDKIDIVQIISSHIPLKKSGRNFKTTCPFHHEKTPSFLVSSEKQIFHCFGCGVGGNALNFLMRYNRCSFGEAIGILADKAGVKLPTMKLKESVQDSMVDRIYNINELAKDYYRDSLLKNKADYCCKYLKERGLTEESIKIFQLGFAPNAWEGLSSFFKTKEIKSDMLEVSGLILPSEKEKGFYDRFRNRIIFPIFDIRNKIIGFGGRVLGDVQPKYINSPETPIYVKGRHLYGLNLSKQYIREKDYAIIVEGYLDLIIPFQYGIRNIVATLGTALSTYQIRLLKRFTRTVVIVYDADKAGEEASLRGLDLLISQDMNVRIATLPKGYDPDSFTRSQGREAFENIIKDSKDLFDYKINLLMNRFNKDGVRGKTAIATLMLPTIARIPNEILKAAFLKKLSEILGIDESALRSELKKIKIDYTYSPPEMEDSVVKTKRAVRHAELLLLSMILDDPRVLLVIDQRLGFGEFRDKNIKKALDAIQLLDKSDKKIAPNKVINHLEDEEAKNLVAEAVGIRETIINKEKVLSDCMNRIKADNFKEDLNRLQMEIRFAQDAKDEEKVNLLVAKYNELIKSHKEEKWQKKEYIKSEKE